MAEPAASSLRGERHERHESGRQRSIPDGWWAEAWQEHNKLEHPIGWSITAPQVGAGQDRADAEALFTLLESKVIPLFFDRDVNGVPHGWCERIKSSIGQVVPYFNTHRMVSEYVERTYVPADRAVANGTRAIEHV